MSTPEETLESLIERCQKQMAHAWMVRTFLKHSEEVEDFPELMEMVRSAFDTSRALETRLDDPPGYFKMLGKKIGKLRKATEQFAIDAPEASIHTNFQQAVISMQTVVDEVESILGQAKAIIQSSKS